ncbi:Bcr/CflA family multidrug efflux MFS transporter [Saccharomonospora saliphila]|uniref:Bcr/CflA family multidrug efflux MFS transporter n=1 Tax=Saccharomonospora saliphila TaxID=369829 RepID=UPI00048E5068|nr:Bcr/CflA family multidrug efflux MFS transporter [Saccharomonospora saliphila]
MSVSTAVADTDVETPRRSRTARFALILGGLTAFGPLSIDMYLPALPVMGGDLHTTDALLQLTLAVFLVGLGVGQLIAGPLSDSWGRRRPLLVGIGIFTVASVVAALSPSVEALIAARAVQAFGAAAGMVVARASVRDLFAGPAMARFFSMLMLVVGLAPILAPVIGGQLLEWTSWRGIFVVLSAFGGLILVIAAAALPETLPTDHRRPAGVGRIVRTYRDLLRDRVFLGYTLTVGLAFAAMFTYISGSSFVLQDLYGLSPSEYSLAFGLNGVGLVATTQVNGRLVGRFAPRSLLRTGVLGITGGAAAMAAGVALGFGLAGVLVPLFVVVSSVGLVMPNATSLALSDHPHTAGSASALLGVVQFLVGGSASPLVGLVGGDSALPMAVIMVAAGIASITAFTVLTRPRTPAAG